MVIINSVIETYVAVNPEMNPKKVGIVRYDATTAISSQEILRKPDANPKVMKTSGMAKLWLQRGSASNR